VMLRKLPVYFTFYKYSFFYSLGIGILMLLLAASTGLSYQATIDLCLSSFTFLGPLIFWMEKALSKQDAYIFYYNLCMTVPFLYMFCLGLNILIAVGLYILL